MLAFNREIFVLTRNIVIWYQLENFITLTGIKDQNPRDEKFVKLFYTVWIKILLFFSSKFKYISTVAI